MTGPAGDLSIALLGVGFGYVAIATLTSRLLPRPPTPEAVAGGQTASKIPGVVLSVSAVLAMVTLLLTKDRLFWAYVVTDSAAIIWCNVSVFFLAVATGAAIRLPGRPRLRTAFNVVAMILLAIASLFQPIVQPRLRPIEGGNQWTASGVCIQSRSTTCSAAAAATLLAAHDLRHSEKEMVRWCLTDARGTPSLGTWRGLCLATEATDWRPEVVSASADELIQKGPWPAILFVGLPTFGADPIYSTQYGWDPGFRHSVVLFGRKDDGMMDVGDPSIGRETWAEEDIRVLWTGEAITLVPR